MPCRAQTLTVAAAADLRPALDEIAAKFQESSGAAVRVTYGSSGNFFQQIQNGAPFDVFLSANLDYPKKLQDAGMVAANSYYEYAQGRIVLAVPAGSPLDLSSGLKALLDPAVKKVAIADPKHAPYGQAAVAALMKEGLYDRVAAKLVTAENISQAASFVLSGAADAGIIATSLSLSPSASGKMRVAEIPADSYPAIRQACVVLSASRQQKLGLQFESFLRAREAGKILQRSGFALPEPARP